MLRVCTYNSLVIIFIFCFAPSAHAVFITPLQEGDINEDVRKLQVFLNTQGFTVSPDGPGSSGNETTTFGMLTKVALIHFQEAYRTEILVPIGLTSGTGYFGPATMAKVNAMLAQSTASSRTHATTLTPSSLPLSTANPAYLTEEDFEYLLKRIETERKNTNRLSDRLSDRISNSIAYTEPIGALTGITLTDTIFDGTLTVNSNTHLTSSDGNIRIGAYDNVTDLTVTGSQTFRAGPMRGVGSIVDGEKGADALAGAIFVDVAGNYAYVLSPTPTSTPSFGRNALQIIDISDPTNPVGVGSVRHGENGVDAMENPRTVTVVGSYAYVACGMNNTGSHSLQIIDISDPTNPIGVGSISDGEKGADRLLGAWGSTVVGNFAYVAGTMDNALQIIDISDPTNPVGVGSIADGENGANNMSRPLHVAVSGRYAYVAAYNDDALQIIDVSDPTNPVGVGSIRDGEKGADALDFPAFVSVIEPYAYVAGYNDNALQIIDISDPTNPVGVGSIRDGEKGADAINAPTSLAVFGDYVVLSSSLSDAIQMVDVSDPTNPIGVGSIRDGERGADSLAYPNWLDLQGNYVYVASWIDNALQVISLEGLVAPTAQISNLLSTDMVSVRSRVTDFLTVDGGLNVGTNALINAALVIGGTASSSLRITNTNPALVVHSGYIGFGTSTPTARLTVDGSVRFAALAGGTLETDALGNLTVSSDEHLKNIISTSTAGLQAVLGLKPIEYYWNETSGLDQSRSYVGFSAQNVQEYLPEAVGETSEGSLTLSTRPILAAVVNAIKDIWNSLKQIVDRVTLLEKENERLHERLQHLEDMLEVEAPASDERQTHVTQDTSEAETQEPSHPNTDTSTSEEIAGEERISEPTTTPEAASDPQAIMESEDSEPTPEDEVELIEDTSASADEEGETQDHQVVSDSTPIIDTQYDADTTTPQESVEVASGSVPEQNEPSLTSSL